jgi:GDP-mannose 4,6 dehydratase
LTLLVPTAPPDGPIYKAFFGNLWSLQMKSFHNKSLFQLPIMASDQIVLVTGISGFIGSHVADQFLEAGYRVRGTARVVSKVDSIKKALELKHGEGRLEVVAVPDMTIDGAFDEAVKGTMIDSSGIFIDP